MGDFEKVLREKFRNLRVSVLSDQENNDFQRVFFGNPFKFLQVLQSKAALMQAQDMNSAGAFDERAFEHNIVGGHETPRPSPKGTSPQPPSPNQISQALVPKKGKAIE